MQLCWLATCGLLACPTNTSRFLLLNHGFGGVAVLEHRFTGVHFGTVPLLGVADLGAMDGEEVGGGIFDGGLHGDGNFEESNMKKARLE